MRRGAPGEQPVLNQRATGILAEICAPLLMSAEEVTAHIARPLACGGRVTGDQGAGLPPVRLHDLRHGAASLALAAGAELKTIQDQLGHSSIVLTADTYISVLPEVARKAAEDTATLVIKAGYLVPGTRRPRHPAFRSLRRRSRAALAVTRFSMPP